MTAVPLIDAPSRRPFHVVCLTTDEAISDLEIEWNALFDRIPDAHPSTNFDWVVAWREYLALDDRRVRASLWTFAVRSVTGSLVAVVPMVYYERSLFGVHIARWLSVGISSPYTDESGLLVAPEDEETVVEALSEYLASEDVDLVLWTGLRSDGAAMSELLRETGAQAENPFSSLVVQLPKSWAALESGLSRYTRKTLRKNSHALARTGNEAIFRVRETPAQVRTALDSLFSMLLDRASKHRTKQPYRFVPRHSRAFLIGLIGGLARKGTVRVFQLSVGDQVVAMRLGLVYRGGIYLYLFADDYAWKKHGVLTILMAETFKYAIENGYRFVYLSTGRSHSNLRWRPTETTYGQVAIWRATLRAKLFRIGRFAWRISTRQISWRRTLFLSLQRLFGQLISMVPRGLRYGVTHWLSRALIPLARLAPAHRELKAMHVERDTDIALVLALQEMDRLDVGYDPPIRLEGEELLREAVQMGRGTLLVGTHALLTQLSPRALTDHGYAYSFVSGSPTHHIAGTTKWITTILRSPYMLVQVRSALRRGELVWALLDRQHAEPDRTTTFHTKLGEIHVSDALLRVAVACGARTLFMMSATDDSGTVRVRISAPASGADASPTALLRDFANTVVEHVASL